MRILLTAAALVFLLAACFNPEGAEDLPNNRAYNVLSSSSWRVTDATLFGNDFSNTYTPFRFNFLETGRLTIETTPGTLQSEGTWSIIDGESVDVDRLELNFLSSDSLRFLNDSWRILNISDTLVECQRNQQDVLVLRPL